EARAEPAARRSPRGGERNQRPGPVASHCVFTGPKAHLDPSRRLGEERDEGAPERHRIARRTDKAGVGRRHMLTWPTPVRDENRQACGLRFYTDVTQLVCCA